MRWAADLPHYDVYAPRDATRCLRGCGGGWGVGGVAARTAQGWVGQAWGRGRTTNATSSVIRIHAADMSASSVVMSPTPDIR